MALPQRARQVRSNKRPPPTPLVQPREQRDVLVEAIETAHYRLEPFAPLPVNVAEAYSRSPATLSSSRVDEDWAFAICGRFVFVWRLAEVKARPLPAISRELPPSSQPITARNVAFLKCANAGSRGLAVVTAEGHIRLWPDVEAVAVHEATVQLDAQAHVTSLTARSEPLSGAVGCSSGAVFLLQAQGYIQLTPLTRPKGMLAGIGSLLGWGRGQSQPASMHPISALLAQQSNLFVLTTGALQRWHGSTLVFEFPLQTAVENWLRDETLTDAMDATEAQVSYRVWLLRMVPGVPGETVHVLVASINALCPPDRLPILSFAVAEVDFSSTPVQLTALRAVQPTDAPLIYDRRTEAEQLASVDLVATQHSLAALMTSSRVSLFRLAHADPELDVVGTMKADDAPLGGGPLGQRLAILSARGVRLAASRVSAAPPSSLPLRRFNNLAAGLDAALSGSPAVYDGPVIEQDLIQEIVARIATQASGGQEPSLLIRQQLEEKRAKFNAMFNMLTESLVWRSLSPAGARRLLDIGEQLDASVGLRSFQNNSTAKPDDQINDIFLKAMQHCVLQSRLVTADRLHSSSVQDVFYAEFSRLGDLIDSLCAVCAASSPPARRDAVDQARILRAALAILQVLLSSARKFRENPRHEVAYQSAAKESGWLFRDTLRENTKRVVVMGLDALVDVARSTNADVAGIAADLADSAKDVVHFTLAFYEDQVRADNGASEQLANNWVAERFRIILPFIEKGLPDRARDLAERFTDFECLIQLSIDAPVPEVGPAPPTLIEYADRYQGHGFVEYLLRYLLTHSRPADILIVGFRFPERFAAWLKDTRRRPEEAAVVQRLGWLLGWQQGDFGRSSLELSQLAAAEEMAGNKGTLLRKKTLASLAVLSALAGGDKTAQEVASRHVDLVDRQERVLGRPATAAPLAAADVIAALLATTREVPSADRTERLRIAAEAFARHCTLSSHQSLWTMMWNEILNDQRVNWAAVGARYQSGASDATFESAVRESALFQILREDFVRERQLLEAENFEKLLAMRQPDERGALRRTYQLALSSRMLQ